MRVLETKEGCILEVSVKPRSKRFGIEIQGDEIIVRSREEPVKGRVNREIINELSRLFAREVELVSGFSSKEKRLLIKGAKKSEVEGLLEHG